MTKTSRFGAYAVMGGMAILATGCLLTPNGTIVPLVAPVVLTSGLPPPAIEVQVAPPAPQYEAVPAPVYGQTWAPGYWNRYGDSWSWVGGRYIVARPGYAYYPGNWVVRAPGTYAYVPGFYRPANRPPPRMPYKIYTGGANVQVYRR